ncbi:reverse transcriptase domain-containing protein [Tanacetum coccineum]
MTTDWFRIASLLLPAGRTAHSRFVIPLELMENSTCGIKQNTQLAELMQETNTTSHPTTKKARSSPILHKQVRVVEILQAKMKEGEDEPTWIDIPENDMSNSDELRHTDNTTLIPPRLPDTLPQVYNRRRPTLGLLILPSVSIFSLTIRRTTHISVLPIEPNLAERARISAINLDDHQLVPVTLPPSPSSPFSMAAYQWMIAETDPTRREEALTAYRTETCQSLVHVPEIALTICTTRHRGQLHTILEDMDLYPNACLEELEAFMTLWDMCEDADDRASNAQEEAQQKRKEALEKVVQRIYLALVTQMPRQLIATRVAKAIAAAAVTHAASTQEETNLGSYSFQIRHATTKNFVHNVAEGDRVKFASSTLLDGALTWWNVYVRSVTLDTAHATPWSDFKAMFIRKYCPRNEVKQMENELWILKGLPLNIKGNVTSSKPVDLHEAIEMAQGLMYQVVQELGENSGDKQKWNENHYNNNNPNTTSKNSFETKVQRTARVFTAGQGQDIRPKNFAGAPPRSRSQEDPKQGGQGCDVTCTDVWRDIQEQNKGNPKELTKAQTALRRDAEQTWPEYTALWVWWLRAAVAKDNNVVNGSSYQ